MSRDPMSTTYHILGIICFSWCVCGNSSRLVVLFRPINVKQVRCHSTSSIRVYRQRPGGALKGQSRGLRLRATATDKHLTTKTIVLAGLLVCDAWLHSWWSCVLRAFNISHHLGSFGNFVRCRSGMSQCLTVTSNVTYNV